MVSTGYRPGGVQSNQSYEPEKVTAVEFGSKNRFNNWLTLNAAVFHYDYSGFQTPQAYGIFPNLQFTIVAVPAEFYGAEIELVARPTQDDTFTLSPTYLHGRFTGNYAYTDPSTGIHSSVPTNGKVVPHQPEWSFNGSYEHRIPLDGGASITTAVDAHYQDRQYTDFDLSLYNGSFNGGPNTVFIQNSYAVYNASINYHSANGKYIIGIYGNNLGNQIYKVTTNGQLNYIADPRTYGIMASLKY
jgi:iron complex outermembrane receptor protein